jgi:hypothetical protein
MVTQKLKVSIPVFALALTLLASCVAPKAEVNDSLDQTIQTLLSAIRARDDSTIMSLAANPQTHNKDGRFEYDVAGFLYDGDYIRGYNADARSVVEIMALGPLLIHKEPQENGGVIVLFLPEQFEDQLQVISFYSERWMRDYFACEFRLIEGRWVLSYNICFAMTDGPFPEPYGLWQAPGAAPQNFAAFYSNSRSGP